MTKTQIDQRITDFEKLVNRHAKKISEIGNASWDPIKESTETPTIRAFLTKKGAGIDYLNMKIARLLSTNGRVVKFAGLFLHGTPMVRGWKRTKSGTKQPISGDCELADLMTVFLYVDSNKTIKRMRSVMFQAKKNASKRGHIVDDPEQRKLYDECEGFKYCNESISKKGDSRMLPKGASRKKALQFMFVEPRPVETRTIPSNATSIPRLEYGNHLVRFLNGKTGLKSETKRSAWGKIVWELMEKMGADFYTDGKTKGPGVQDVLTHFNSFESHKTWCIDEGSSESGFGVQLVIVWDGDIRAAEPQTKTLPEVLVKVVKVKNTDDEDLALYEEMLAGGEVIEQTTETGTM